MTERDDNQGLRGLLLPYVLGELDAVERRRVERALDVDPALRRELEALEAVGARIVSGIELTPAPTALKGRVMDAVRGVVERTSPDHSARTAPAAARQRPARRRAWFASPAIAGSLAAACLVLGVVAVDLGRSLDAAERRAERLERASNGDRPAPVGLEGAEPFTVSTSGPFDEAKGSLLRVAEDRWILLLRDVPSPGYGKSWQVWTADSRGIIRNVDQWQDGSTQLLVLDRADITRVMVSYEPTTRPVPAPSSEPVASVEV